MRIKAGNFQSQDGLTLDFGPGFTLAETDREVKVSNPNAADLKQLGGAGDGVTDDTAVVTAAQLANALIFTPPGTFKTTIAETSLTGRFRGVGQIQDVGGNKRAPWFSALSAAPSSVGNWGGPSTAFNGDLSHVQIALEHRVTGAATLGQPATGYVFTQEAGPIVSFLYNSSGWNQATNSPTGRTGVAAFYSQVSNAGQGDTFCYYASGLASGARAGATSFLANPAASLYVGQIFAGQAGVYMNPVEYHLDDQGVDAAGIGLIIGLKRTNVTGALDACWGGVRVSTSGTQPTDVAFMAVTGNTSGDAFRVGLDLANAGLATTGTWVSAAVTLSADQRIYLNATGSDVGASLYRRPSATGNTYITYASGLPGLNFVVGGVSSLQVLSNQVTFAQAPALADGVNMRFGTTTGSIIAPNASQKISFWGVTPTTQPNGTGNTHTVAAGATTTVFTNTTFDGSTGTTAYTVGDIVAALKKVGFLAA